MHQIFLLYVYISIIITGSLNMKRILAGLLCLILFAVIISGQGEEKNKYRATRVAVSPVINGILDDEAWEAGTWAGGFKQWEPYNGREPSQRTEFKILFDDQNLYVAIKAFDSSPDSIVKRLTRRDNTDGDMVAVVFDSYHDLRTGFWFGVSAGGVRNDELMSNDGQNEDFSDKLCQP